MENDLDWLLNLQLDLVKKIDKRMENDLLVTIQMGKDEQRIKWMYHMIDAMHNELEEVRNELPWKSWRDYSKYKFEEKLPLIKEEVIDLLHFFLDMCLILGISADELRNAYKKKQQKNIDRQLNNY